MLPKVGCLPSFPWPSEHPPRNASASSIGKPAPLHITSPTSGMVIHLDPDVNQGTGKLLLQATPSDGIEWLCETLPLEKQGPQTWAKLAAGEHLITAQRGAEQVQARIRVVKD